MLSFTSHLGSYGFCCRIIAYGSRRESHCGGVSFKVRRASFGVSCLPRTTRRLSQRFCAGSSAYCLISDSSPARQVSDVGQNVPPESTMTEVVPMLRDTRVFKMNHHCRAHPGRPKILCPKIGGACCHNLGHRTGPNGPAAVSHRTPFRVERGPERRFRSTVARSAPARGIWSRRGYRRLA